MTSAEQRDFVETLIDSCKADVLSKLDQVPEEWDGYELRLLVNERLSDQILWGKVDKSSERYKAYRQYAVKHFLI